MLFVVALPYGGAIALKIASADIYTAAMGDEYEGGLMEQELREDIAASCEARISFCRFLASLFLLELTQEQIDTLATCRVPKSDSEIGQGYALIKEYLRHRDSGTRQELAVDYARVFLGAGNYDKITAPPYESVFTSENNLLMQEARDGAVAFYRREGVSLPQDNTTPEDHLGYELEFMAILIEKFSQELNETNMAEAQRLLQAQEEFFSQHLENWLPTFSLAIDKHAKTDFYRGVACLVRGYIQTEREILDDLSEVLSAEEA